MRPLPEASPDTTARGTELRQARLRCGVSLSELARELGVPSGDLRALEWGRFDLLGGDRYARKLRDKDERWLTPDRIPRPVRSSGELKP
ncbi:MAG: helix-turn-helix domain-containing protein [Actinobacteria bacterium]|nr:helix-turn-helix domain-containing protein [Actinomycetota bacterium]